MDKSENALIRELHQWPGGRNPRRKANETGSFQEKGKKNFKSIMRIERVILRVEGKKLVFINFWRKQEGPRLQL